MVKSTAVFLGFLFALSTAYYLSFWTSFDIDVFQYIAIEDIIKGIAYPLRFAGIWIIITILFLTAVFAISGLDTAPKNFHRTMWTLLSVSVIAWAFFKYVSSTTFIGVAFSVVLSVLLALIYFNLIRFHEADKEAAEKEGKPFAEKHPAVSFFNILTVYAFIFLPINAIVAGQVDAKAIHENREYNYVMSRDLPSDKIHVIQPYLILLGAVSEKYIFIDKGQTERFIIDKEQLPAMRIHHYDSTDSSSVRHLEICLLGK